MSNREITIAEYMEMGLSREEAEAQACKEVLTDALYGGLVGGLSGGISADSSYAAGWLLNGNSSLNSETESPVEKEAGTPQERVVASIASANVAGVGESQKAATLTGVLNSFGVESEEGAAAAKNIVKTMKSSMCRT